MGPLVDDVQETAPELVEEVEPTLEDKVDELLEILRPLRPVIQQAPEALAKLGPFLEKLENNPLLRGFLR